MKKIIEIEKGIENNPKQAGITFNQVVGGSNPPCLIPLDPWQFAMDFFVVFFVVLLESLFPFSEFGKLYGKICLVSHENR